MRRAWQAILVLAMGFIVPAAFAQTPPAGKREDLDVTMRVLVDPDAKVPDEIVRRITLPKPEQSTEPAKKSDKPAEPGAQGQQRASEAREQGREFGQQVSEQAKQRSEEARRNATPPAGPPANPNPPGRPTPRPPR